MPLSFVYISLQRHSTSSVQTVEAPFFESAAPVASLERFFWASLPSSSITLGGRSLPVGSIDVSRKLDCLLNSSTYRSSS